MIVAVRDKTIASLQEQIANRRRLLRENNQKLNIILDENEYLSEISQDYRKYFEHMKEQKEQQIKAFSLIHKYLERLIKSNQITEAEMINAMRDQREILEQINGIKTELDEMIDEDK